LFQTLFGNRGYAVFGNLMKLASGMGPAISQLDWFTPAVLFGQPVITGIAIDL